MRKRVLGNIFSGLFSQIISSIYGFVIPILIVKYYGSNINGLVSSIVQFIAYINLLQIGIGPVIKNALYEPIAKNNKEKIASILGATNSFFKRIAYCLIGYVVILCIVFPFINNEFPRWFSTSLILIISFGTFFEYFFGMTYRLFLTSNQKNYIVDYVNILGHIISLIVIYILIKYGRSIQSVRLVGSIVFIIKPILLKIYFEKKYNIKIEKKSNYIFKNKWNGFAHHIAATVQGNTDVVVLTIFSTLSNVSIYSIYNLIISGINNIVVSLTNGIDGYFGKLLVKDESKINKKFDLYSFCFYSIVTIFLACTLILITPFVSVYTVDIKDANYIQWTFGYVLVFAEFNYAIRYPFSALVYSKGHFKQTTKYAIVEPIVNIILSIIMVKKFGLIGVAIGTLVSMPIRSFGFIYHGIKYILHDSFLKQFKIIFISYVELIIVLLLRKKLLFITVNSFYDWFLLAIIVFIVLSLSILILNYLLIRPKFGLLEKKNEK